MLIQLHDLEVQDCEYRCGIKCCTFEVRDLYTRVNVCVFSSRTANTTRLSQMLRNMHGILEVKNI